MLLNIASVSTVNEQTGSPYPHKSNEWAAGGGELNPKEVSKEWKIMPFLGRVSCLLTGKIGPWWCTGMYPVWTHRDTNVPKS